MKAAIMCVLQQGVDLEVLVIDGQSSDRTVEVVNRFDDPRVRLLQNPSRTIPHALNIGLQHARGTFVARVDAHATISSTYLATGLVSLRDGAVAGVGGKRVGIARSDTGRAIAAALSSPFGVGNSINHYGFASLDTDHASFGVYRTSVARAIGGWDESLPANEDVDFDHRILLAGHRIRYEPTMQINWQVRESLSDFALQYRRYGRGKGAMVLKNGRSAIRLRHTAAPALVGWFALTLLTALAGRPKVAIAMAAPYVTVVCIATVETERKLTRTTRVSPLRLASAFVTMHVSWGYGLLEGVTLRRRPAEGSALGVEPKL